MAHLYLKGVSEIMPIFETAHIGFPPFTGVCRMAVSTASTYFGDARRGTARLAALAAPTMQRLQRNPPLH